ncbi:MAG TPA: nucleotidyltransferase domain-containing protein [Bacteroidales bacterium]|nr:nucleotidyltransferase domain-containing protein [Bacteroidales bacterium]HPI85919.1 nucleotidyltransferase domain-containing protein [Bacteroidales bacterium]HPM91252.1 nucleotidyltransferase domain-containing protein [Bacteroidales bacterium]
MQVDIDHIIKLCKPVFKKYGINSASIVGSMAYGDYSETSDLDVVVEISQSLSLLTFSKIKIELEEVLNRKVDLIVRSTIKERMKKSMLAKEIIIAL